MLHGSVVFLIPVGIIHDDFIGQTYVVVEIIYDWCRIFLKSPVDIFIQLLVLWGWIHNFYFSIVDFFNWVNPSLIYNILNQLLINSGQQCIISPFRDLCLQKLLEIARRFYLFLFFKLFSKIDELSLKKSSTSSFINYLI